MAGRLRLHTNLIGWLSITPCVVLQVGYRQLKRQPDTALQHGVITPTSMPSLIFGHQSAKSTGI